jgi:hypothetical protein
MELQVKIGRQSVKETFAQSIAQVEAQRSASHTVRAGLSFIARNKHICTRDLGLNGRISRRRMASAMVCTKNDSDATLQDCWDLCV